MADIAESAPFTDATIAISQGKRHLLVRDYAMAVTALAQACELLAEKHGDTADELGEPYLLYGRALLGLAREETGVLGGGVPGSENTDDDDDADDDEDKDNEKSSVSDSREQEEDEDVETTEDKGGAKEGKRESQRCSNEKCDIKNITKNETDHDNNASTKIVENSDQENGVRNSSRKTTDAIHDLKGATNDQENNTNHNTPDNRSTDETNSENSESTSTFNNKEIVTSTQEKHEAVPVSKLTDTDNKLFLSGRVPTSMDRNSDEVENRHISPNNIKEGSKGLTANEDEQEDETEDEVNNLQVAWEVLELAKLVLLKRGPSGWKLLADSYRLLGEVAMEGGNHQGALDDLQGCLNLLQKIKPQEPRAIAEIHYQLGLAYSLANDFDTSIEQFNEATKLLEARIKELESMTEPPKSNDPFYTIEGEIQELRELLPEIQEKITDMRDFKQEARKYVIEGIKSKAHKECSNMAAGSSGELSSSKNNESNTQTPIVQKLATDISHLIRKKRKAEETETDMASPSKKPAPDEAV